MPENGLGIGGLAHDGCLVASEDRVSWLVGSGAVVRSPEQAEDHLAVAGHGIEIAQAQFRRLTISASKGAQHSRPGFGTGFKTATWPC